MPKGPKNNKFYGMKVICNIQSVLFKAFILQNLFVELCFLITNSFF